MNLEAKVARLEATEEIRQLVSRYALGLDSRDVDKMASLFVPTVTTHDGRVGREALADWFRETLSAQTVTFHLIGNHVIDFVDDDNANGVVYCRPEHQVDDQWIIMPMQYWDRYQRVDGHWYFKSRSVHAFYAADITENPAQLPGRWNFPNNPFVHKADLPERFATWQAYWGEQ